MKISPFPFDFRTRPIKFVEAGSLFIAVDDTKGVIKRILDAKVKPVTLPSTSKGGPVTSVNALSYHLLDDATSAKRSVFLLCGMFDYEAEGADFGLHATGSVIYASKDGLEWSEKFVSKTATETDKFGKSVGVFSICNALVWHHDAFFYTQRKSATEVLVEQIYTSGNGDSWNLVKETEILYGAEDAGYRSSFPPDYCDHNDCIDALGQHVPDGYMQKDEATGTVMRPAKPPTIKYGVPSVEAGTSDKVEVVDKGSKSPGVGTVWSVAGADGTWIAGGETGAAISTDIGETWKPVDDLGPTYYIIGGRL